MHDLDGIVVSYQEWPGYERAVNYQDGQLHELKTTREGFEHSVQI
jgi:hypothetical protein